MYMYKNADVWWCLDCVWGCLDGVWMVSGSGLRVFGDVLIPNLLATILHHGTQILPLILVPCIA